MRNLIVTPDHITALRRLQEIETETARAEKKLYGDGAKPSALGQRLEGLNADLAEVRDHLEEEKKRYGAIEEEIADLVTRVAKSKEYLRVVTNNKEYQLLRREVDDNAKRIGELETLQVTLMEETEDLESKMNALEGDCAAEETKVKKIELEIFNDTAEERESIASMIKERAELAGSLPLGLLDHYEKILKTSDRLAVVAVSNGTCYGCFLTIPPQQVIDIQKHGGLHYCPRCHRILFSKDNA